jgi:2,4-dienoyl-CoA reductase-like NADH-dependent reductase (Old Yellow Enzyme family)/thioredoxin reductase
VTSPYPKLFEPAAIGSVRLRNRLVMCAMNDNFAGPDGYPHQQEIDYYAARAAGGVGLLVTGNAFIDDDVSKISIAQIGVHDDRLLPGLARLAEAIHNQGTAVVLQLAHAGPQTLPETIRFRQTFAPSAELWVDASRELTVADIEGIVGSFVAAASRAERAGFDGVEIHCAHGYLLSSFLSPNSNRRTDAFGGSFENRTRIVRDIFDRARRAVGAGFLLGAKINSSDLVSGGATEEDGLALARALERWGATYIAVSRGVGDSVDEMIAPLYYPRLQNIPAARRIKAEVSIPVIAMGAILDPADAEAVLEGGDADFVAVGRGLIADPEWGLKALRGQPETIRPCIRCNECVAMVDENRELRCAVNAEVGREGQPILPATVPKSVLVLGGGPGGCEAALVAASRGHRVRLVEARERLGGASVPKGNPEFKRELERLPAWYEAQLDALGVEVTLSTLASVDLVEELAPDVIVYAIGAEPSIPAIPGVDAANVVSATDYLEMHPDLGERVAVLGAGFVGCETALHLAQLGKVTSLVSRRGADELALDLNATVRLALRREMDRAEVRVVERVDVVRIDPGHLVLREVDGEAENILEVDAVVLARGFTPRRDLAEELIGLGYDVRLVGDTRTTGLIFDAVQQGHAVARVL